MLLLLLQLLRLYTFLLLVFAALALALALPLSAHTPAREKVCGSSSCAGRKEFEARHRPIAGVHQEAQVLVVLQLRVERFTEGGWPLWQLACSCRPSTDGYVLGIGAGEAYEMTHNP